MSKENVAHNVYCYKFMGTITIRLVQKNTTVKTTQNSTQQTLYIYVFFIKLIPSTNVAV